MEKATLKFVERMFGTEDVEGEVNSKWEGDNAFQGLQIIAKYIDPMKKSIIGGASHDVIYSANVQELLDLGITEDDVKALAMLNWSYDEESESFNCFV